MKNNEKTGYPSIDKPWLKYFDQEVLDTHLPECTVYEYLWENNRDHLEDTALNYFDRKITYHEVFSNIDNATNAFARLGIRAGDIVVMTTVTIPETIYAFYALNRLGAISNMVDPRTSIDGIRDYILEVNARWVLTIDVAYPKIEKAINGTSVERVIVTSPADSLPVAKGLLFHMANRLKGAVPKLNHISIQWKRFLKNGDGVLPKLVPYKKDSCCVIVHTGGTTGAPKGVMLSNDNLNVMALQYRLLGVDFNRKQNFLNIMPPFIAYGVVLGVHMPLVLGLNDVLIPQFDPEKFAELIVKYRPAHLLGVPSHYEKLRTSPKMEGCDLHFFESAGAGGDAITAKFEVDINHFLQTHNSKYQIAKGYGMTEISSAATACHGTVNKLQSVGIPHLFTTVTVFSPDTGEELKVGEQGEICMCAPTVMLGYYHNEKETSAILKKHSDGKLWIHSGDIGHMDEDGFLYIDGRLKRVIIRHDGFKVFPSLIENTVSSHEDVVACCAVGVPDVSYHHGKLPVVFVSLNDGSNDKRDIKSQLVELCEKNLPEYAQPVEFYFCDTLPLTSIGKIDYLALEQLANEQKQSIGDNDAR